MKISCPINEITVTQSALARALGLTQPRINQMIQDGVVIRDEKDPNGGIKLLHSLKNYFMSKSGNTGGTEEEDAEASYWKEHSKHERAKRQLAELKLEKERGRLYEAKTVELAMTEQLVMLRTKLLGMPTKLAAILEGKDKGAIFDILNTEIEENLSEMSKYNPDMFKEEIDDRVASEAVEG